MPSPARPGGVAAGTGWTVAKLPLTMRKRFRQPLLVRGRRLDEPGVVGFSGLRRRRPFAAMQFPPRARAIDLGRFKGLGLTLWANKSGCYGLQLDGKAFSGVVVLRVQLT